MLPGAGLGPGLAPDSGCRARRCVSLRRCVASKASQGGRISHARTTTPSLDQRSLPSPPSVTPECRARGRVRPAAGPREGSPGPAPAPPRLGPSGLRALRPSALSSAPFLDSIVQAQYRGQRLRMHGVPRQVGASAMEAEKRSGKREGLAGAGGGADKYVCARDSKKRGGRKERHWPAGGRGGCLGIRALQDQRICCQPAVVRGITGFPASIP